VCFGTAKVQQVQRRYNTLGNFWQYKAFQEVGKTGCFVGKLLKGNKKSGQMWPLWLSRKHQKHIYQSITYKPWYNAGLHIKPFTVQR